MFVEQFLLLLNLDLGDEQSVLGRCRADTAFSLDFICGGLVGVVAVVNVVGVVVADDETIEFVGFVAGCVGTVGACTTLVSCGAC